MKKKKRNSAQPGRVVRTLAEVAQHFGVSRRTVDYWRAWNMPGKSGAYDLAAIDEWRKREGLGLPESGGARERLFLARARREELRLDQLAGNLIPLDPVIRLMTRHINEARAILDQLPDQVAACLSPRTSAETRKQVREAVATIVDNSCDSLADMLAASEVESPKTE